MKLHYSIMKLHYSILKLHNPFLLSKNQLSNMEIHFCFPKFNYQISKSIFAFQKSILKLHNSIMKLHYSFLFNNIRFSDSFFRFSSPKTRFKLPPCRPLWTRRPLESQEDSEDQSPLRNLFEISRTKVSGVLRIPRCRKSIVPILALWISRGWGLRFAAKRGFDKIEERGYTSIFNFLL